MKGTTNISPRGGNLWLAVGLIVAAASIFCIWYTISNSDLEGLGVEQVQSLDVDPPSSNGVLSGGSPTTPSTDSVNAPDPAPVEQLGNLQREALGKMSELEAARSKLLAQVRRPMARGSETWFLFGIDPPTNEEVKSVRKMIGEMQRQLDGAQLQEIDDSLSWMLNTYDSFGMEKKRVLIVQVPDDPNNPVYGMSYSTNDFQQEVDRVQPNVSFNHTLDNLHLFIGGDDPVLTRFYKLVEEDVR